MMILSVGAHLDDSEYGIGGTLIREIRDLKSENRDGINPFSNAWR
jgi:hypothetical protein